MRNGVANADRIIFIGSVAQIREDLYGRRERFGLSYFVAPDRDLPTIAEIVGGL